MRFNEIINNIVDDYVQAWNHKDVKKILGIFCDGAEVESPIFSSYNTGIVNVKIVGKEQLEQNYNNLFNSTAYFKMRKIHVEKHDKTITTYVNSLNNNEILKSTFTLNEYGKLASLRITKEDTV